MGGRQQVYRKYERYQSERVDGASCLCSDDVTMMVSDGGDKLIRWSSGPDHIEPTLGPCYGKNGEVGRSRAQLDAAPPRATPKTVSHNDTLYHISTHRSVTALRCYVLRRVSAIGRAVEQAAPA